MQLMAKLLCRLIYTAYDLETNKMIGLLVSHRYKCVINNDTPDSAPHETLSMTMDNDWSGWDIGMRAQECHEDMQ